jgi:hypothetical protein
MDRSFKTISLCIENDFHYQGFPKRTGQNRHVKKEIPNCTSGKK